MSRYDIDIETEVAVAEALVERVREAATAVLLHHNQPPTSLTILLADDDHLQQLNRDFLGYDKPTDVLSFPAGDPLPGMDPYLGDIAISLPTATRQAEQTGHPLADELQLLAVHGTLHLLGYDHAEPADKEAMWSAQAEILAKVGVQLQEDPAQR